MFQFRPNVGRTAFFCRWEETDSVPRERREIPSTGSLSDLAECLQTSSRPQFFFISFFFLSKMALCSSTCGSICSDWTDGFVFPGRYRGHQHFLCSVVPLLGNQRYKNPLSFRVLTNVERSLRSQSFSYGFFFSTVFISVVCRDQGSSGEANRQEVDPRGSPLEFMLT